VSIRRVAAAATLIFCLLALASCGGGSDGSESSSTEHGSETSGASGQAPQAVIVTASKNCVEMLREVNRIGQEAKRTPYKTVTELTTKGFAEPGLKLIKNLAKSQQQLQGEAESEAFEAYAASFDPIVVLGEQWLQAERANDTAKAERLQQLLTNLGTEQRVLASRAGLPECSVNFLHAMVRSASS
jgi:hypothetical protein